ncbi:MAG: phosphate ABC transporter permease PstA [Melioribacteraceae bacterium]|nr:phosphate ABC transporter permease PstA [Melioribacteraceae bacterium]MCF8263257.1 phosphate ABC transporter permease PstA [Melioribacteraceae bacterium]MCF8412872.1 phosphate ABC transporter permease PstA [Melioribacteraceae bacterium]MCF8430697.1 phosphate ABC transporter permease PstA [Melioribacteraceae bacterium]
MAQRKITYQNLKTEKRIWKTEYNIPLIFIGIFTAITFLVLFYILGKIFYEGVEVISWEFLTSAPRNNMTEGGIGPAIFGTILIAVLMMLFAVPIGVFSAIYLNEFAHDGVLKKIIRISVNNLAAVPSIVFGLFGFGFFVLLIGQNLDEILQTGLLFGKPAMLWASATLAVLVLPTIIVSTTEALNSVPQSQRAAAFGLGAGRWETIREVILPQAKPGILTGVILALSRGAGETAPILFLGCAFFLPNLPIGYIDLGLFSIPMINPTEQFMYLSYHIFIMATQSANPTLTRPLQYGTALVLIFTTVLLNATAIVYRYKFRKILKEVN